MYTQSLFLTKYKRGIMSDTEKNPSELLGKILENQIEAFKLIDENFTSLHERIEGLESEVSRLTDSTSLDFKQVKSDIKSGLDSVHTELKKISQVVPYEEQLLNIPSISKPKGEA